MSRRSSRLRAAAQAAGSLLFMLWLALITPPFSALALASAPLPPQTRYFLISRWSYLVVFALRHLCGIRHRVSGLHHLPPQPAVLLSRHESAWETIAFQTIFPPQSFVLKKSLLRIPFFGWGLRQMSPIAINRAAGAQALRQLLAQGRERLAAGFCVVVFPEGTRMPADQSRKYFAGGAQLALASGAPLLPVAINSGACWPKNGFFKRRGCIQVRIGAPLATDSQDAAALTEAARRWIERERADMLQSAL